MGKNLTNEYYTKQYIMIILNKTAHDKRINWFCREEVLKTLLYKYVDSKLNPDANLIETLREFARHIFKQGYSSRKDFSSAFNDLLIFFSVDYEKMFDSADEESIETGSVLFAENLISVINFCIINGFDEIDKMKKYNPFIYNIITYCTEAMWITALTINAGSSKAEIFKYSNKISLLFICVIKFIKNFCVLNYNYNFLKEMIFDIESYVEREMCIDMDEVQLEGLHKTFASIIDAQMEGKSYKARLH